MINSLGLSTDSLAVSNVKEFKKTIPIDQKYKAYKYVYGNVVNRAC